ncbi:hypothetical protein JCM8097_005159 [Rhodosporidiobolus ruineniae]
MDTQDIQPDEAAAPPLPGQHNSLQPAYAALSGSGYPYSISPAALHYPTLLPSPALTPTGPPQLAGLSPASLAPPVPGQPARTAPPDHALSLSSAVESARWNGDFPSLSQPVLPVAFSAPALPPPLFSDAFTSGGAAAFSHLPTAATVGSVLASVPSLAGPSPPANALHLRRNSSDLEGPLGFQSRIKPFISKLLHLLSRPDAYADCITWDGEGKAFIVHHCQRFHSEVLPRVFGHQNSASFTRQLNVYGFRRLTNTELVARIDVKSTQDYSGWIHDAFTRGDRASLHLLTPRPSRARLAKKEEKARKAEAAAYEDGDDSAVGGHGVGERRASRDSQASSGTGSAFSTPLMGSHRMLEQEMTEEDVQQQQQQHGW